MKRMSLGPSIIIVELIIFMTRLKLSASIIRLKKSEEKDEAQKEFKEYYGSNAVNPVWVSVPGDFASM
ncbi:MAG: hypothetical protein M1417_01215 [Candidatus Thermoplasmatota archaeon]|nr:hypothetical protein [Candidatus Thermoplasmatota archaeon]